MTTQEMTFSDYVAESKALREVNRRENNGIVVSLLLDPRDGQVYLCAEDVRRPEDSVLALVEKDRAKWAFEHPFVYAAERQRAMEVELRAMGGER